METIFLNYAGTVQFVRDDMEQGNWTQEEYTVNATFPYDSGKVITRGMRIAFRDPATDVLQVFEIRNVTNIEPDHYQQIIAEHIAVSELSDDHTDTTEITNKTAAQALTTLLSGSLWSVGNNTASGTSSADIGRGSKWQGVNTIANNWNVYITPRVTINSAGSITGRYLDIAPHTGTWNGVRLSVDKNISDSSVVYDDSEVITAMYGYGGMITVENATTPNTSVEQTFAGVTWSATSSHPAKPSGQKYIEYPEKTALYGRNGRPRYGYYQNSEITDASTLLQKTWEVLQTTCDPKICISGTVSDLYRLGYKDEPLKLHDSVIVEIRPTGEVFQKTVIKLDVDLIDPTATRPEIGDYIPNIIYINRETNSVATTGEEVNASGGGGGGGRGQSNSTKYEYDTYSGLEKHTDENGSMIAMVVGKYDGTNYIKAGEIGLAINHTGDPGNPYETKAYINADHVNISATNTAYALAGDLQHDADGKLIIKSAGGMYVQRTDQGVTTQFGVFDNGNLTAGVIATKVNGVTSTHIQAENIYIGNEKSTTVIAGKCSLSDVTANYIQSKINDLSVLHAGSIDTGSIDVEGTVDCSTVEAGNVKADYLNGNDTDDIIVNASVSGNTLTLTKGSGGTVTFSKATSLSGAWASGVFTASASPQGTTLTTSLAPGTGTWNGTTVTIPIYATIGNSGTVYNTGKSATATYTGTSEYNRGWNACRNAMIESQYWWTGWTGTESQVMIQGVGYKWVISPYQSANHYRYIVPDAK